MVQSQKHFIPEGLGEKVIGHDIWKFTHSDSDVMTITFDPKSGDHPFSIAAHGDVFCGDLNAARLQELKADITHALQAQKYYKVASK